MDAIVARLVEWAKGQPEILALYLYGSVAEQRHNALSDLDIGLLLRPEITKQEVWRLEDRWSALWPEVVDLRVLNYAPTPFQFEVTRKGQRLWVADMNLVAEQESLIWRKYRDEKPRLKEDMEVHKRQVVEARDATQQKQYRRTLETIAKVHRRVREAAASAVRRLSG